MAIEPFQPADYQHICGAYLDGMQLATIDMVKVHRFAPKLNGHQLKAAGRWFAQYPGAHTEAFIEYLRSQRMASNVELGEVSQVDLKELRGVDDVLRQLEANIVVPLEHDDLVARVGAGAEAGRAAGGAARHGKDDCGAVLAHRLRGKFFLIDGTFISGTEHFYQNIHRVFEAAKENAPAVIFIDDSDVIFESGEEHGLYRYLLTMLDGLESKSAGRVCVMMTAMDVGNLPPALIRSGRIELWLEMRLPNDAAREQILQQLLAKLPAVMSDVDVAQLVAATESFTGADLKRTVQDGKALYGYDRARKLPLKSPTEYFLAAVENVQSSKAKYAEAEGERISAARNARRGFSRTFTGRRWTRIESCVPPWGLSIARPQPPRLQSVVANLNLSRRSAFTELARGVVVEAFAEGDAESRGVRRSRRRAQSRLIESSRRPKQLAAAIEADAANLFGWAAAEIRDGIGSPGYGARWGLRGARR